MEKKSIKLLVFKNDEIPNMQKGRGVTLQKYKSGKTLFALCFNSSEGLATLDKGKTILKESEIKKWFGKRAQAGKIEPKNLHLKF